MSIRRVDPEEAARLLEEGWTYLDVRSTLEFGEGHPAGAWNIPLLDFVPGQGMRPNPDFLDEVRAAFPEDHRLVVGCKAGGRSAAAAAALAQSGFTSVVDMKGGFLGEADGFGRLVCEGWAPRGLPVSRTPEPGRSHDEIRSRRR